MRRVALPLILVLVVAACGGDDSGGSAADDAPVTAGADEPNQCDAIVDRVRGAGDDLDLAALDFHLDSVSAASDELFAGGCPDEYFGDLGDADCEFYLDSTADPDDAAAQSFLAVQQAACIDGEGDTPSPTDASEDTDAGGDDSSSSATGDPCADFAPDYEALLAQIADDDLSVDDADLAAAAQELASLRAAAAEGGCTDPVQPLCAAIPALESQGIIAAAAVFAAC